MNNFPILDRQFLNEGVFGGSVVVIRFATGVENSRGTALGKP
jgi:hypothetical protein